MPKGWTIWSGLLAIALATPAYAQSSQSDDGSEIIVTARKREENLQEVGAAISVLDGQALEDAQIRQFEDITNLAPSLSLTSSSSGRGVSLNVRGVGSQAFGGTVEPSVAVVVDEVVLGETSQAFGELFDIERIEVLRGPQGTLFGKNSSAGVINVVTRSPTDELEGELQGEYDEDQNYRVRGVVSGPLLGDLSARVAAYYRQNEDYIENLGGDALGNSEASGVRARFLYEPNANLAVTGIVEYSESEGTGPQFVDRTNASTDRAGRLGLAAASEENALANVNTNQDGRDTLFGASLRFDAEAGGLNFVSVSSYRETDSFGQAPDVDGLPVATPALTLPAATPIALSSFDRGVDGFVDAFIAQTQLNDSELMQLTQELRLQSADPGALEWVLGAFGFLKEGRSGGLRRDAYAGESLLVLTPGANQSQCGITATCSIRNLAATEIRGSGQTYTESFAAFGQLDWAATEALNLSFGARVTNDHVEATSESIQRTLQRYNRTATNYVAQGAQQVTSSPGGVVTEAESTGWSGRAAVEYAMSDDLFGYVSYSRGYKGPAPQDGGVVVDPETVDSYEIGARTTWLDGALVINGTLFHSAFEDFQVQAFNTDTQSFQLENAGAVTSQGVELDVIARPSSNLSFQVGVAYTDAEIDEFDGAKCFNGQTAAQGCVYAAGVTATDNTAAVAVPNVPVFVPLGQDLSGARVPNSAEWRANFVGRAEFPMPSLGATGYLSGAYRWQSSVQYCLSQHPGCVQDSFGVLNAAVGMQFFDGALEAEIFGRNLTDQFYVSTIIETPTQVATPGNLGTTSQVVPRDSARIFGVALRSRF